MSRTDTCARCEHFGLREHPEQAAHGLGRCKGFDGHVAPVEPFVRWNATPCVLFGKAKDMAIRQGWIDRQTAKEAK